MPGNLHFTTRAGLRLPGAKQLSSGAQLTMVTESTLAAWTGPSSDTEQEKQDRTERMIREAVAAHAAFRDCSLSIYAKGSYANSTNVRADSDVDIAVECTDVEYWEESSPGVHSPGAPYQGIWTPAEAPHGVDSGPLRNIPAER